MKGIICLLGVFTSMVVSAQNNVNIVPMPVEVKMGKGIFSLDKTTVIVLEGSNLEKSATILNDYLQKQFAYKLNVQKKSANSNSIRINYERMDKESAGAYNLTVDKNGISIAGDNEAGVFYGIQTLMQLLPGGNNSQSPVGKQRTTNNKLTIPQLSIKDYPRFPYRGMHLDVSRHFFPVSFIKKYIDYLAAYKFNTFHWHLTDDQGWRIEIKKYPGLTKIGSKRNGTIIGRYPGKGNDNIPYGGFYTQADIKEVLAYAKERYIDVIPEIEMPGHGSAAIAAYPWLSCFPAEPTAIPAKMISQKSIEEQKNGKIKLVQETWGVFDDVFCAGKDSTFMFLENVIDEVIKLFPSKYFHLGADECPKTHWQKCPYCQKRMKDNNLKDEHELQSWFVQRIEKYLNSKGKTMIGWDEILEGGLAPNAVVMSWRGEAGGIEAAKQKHDVIMTPGNPLYFDHSQSSNEDSVTIGGYNPIENVYAYDPVPKELTTEQGKYILGAQANVWTEYIGNTKKVEYMIFPRMAALSEVLWTPKDKKDWKGFERRLPSVFERLDREKINYSGAYFDLKATVLPTEDFDGVLWKLESNYNRAKINYSWGVSSHAPDYNQPIKITETQSYGATLYLPIETEKISKFSDSFRTLSTVTQKFYFNKATGKKITIVNPPSKSYPGNGAFTLVDGVQNEKGMAKSSEFLGFNGTDLDVTIDLGKEMKVSKVTLHVLKQTGSWIYLPKQVEVTFIPYIDSNIVTKYPSLETVTVDVNTGDDLNKIEIKKEKYCRYIQVHAKNYGIIPSGQAGGGNPAWLFVDEIEVE